MTIRTLFAAVLMCSSLPAFGQTADSASSEEQSRFFKPHFDETEAVPSFGQIFRDLGKDFKRLPSRENAMWLGIGAGLAAASTPLDHNVSHAFHGWSSSEDALKPGATLGGFYATMGAAFATYAVGRVAHDPKIAIVGADLVRAQILSQATTYGVKLAASRTRPNGDPRSFPSGHTSSAFATATVLERHFGWKVGAPAYAFASYVGASRIQANKHYLSDVMFGAALGIVAGRTVTIGRSKVEIGPIVVPGGGVGIGLSLAQ